MDTLSSIVEVYQVSYDHVMVFERSYVHVGNRGRGKEDKTETGLLPLQMQWWYFYNLKTIKYVSCDFPRPVDTQFCKVRNCCIRSVVDLTSAAVVMLFVSKYKYIWTSPSMKTMFRFV